MSLRKCPVILAASYGPAYIVNINSDNMVIPMDHDTSLRTLGSNLSRSLNNRIRETKRMPMMTNSLISLNIVRPVSSLKQVGNTLQKKVDRIRIENSNV